MARGPDPAPNPGGYLAGVTTLSRTQAWIVGSAPHGPLILHWNGIRWRRQILPPGPGGGPLTGVLNGVTAIGPNNVWAVGERSEYTPARPLILHWNGRAWRYVRCPFPRNEYYLDLWDVAAASAHNIWAVGDYSPDQENQSSYMLHWNGTKWTWHPCLTGYEIGFTGVSALTGPNQAWAAGYDTISHWNGTKWTWRAVARGFFLPADVAAVSARDVWAVGSGEYSGSAIIAHWNGRVWRTVRPRASAGLTRITAPSAHCAWAIGDWQILHWNGTHWRRQTVPRP